MICDTLFKRIDELQNEYIDFLIDICNIESPTSCKSGVDAVGRYFIDKAKIRGWSIIVHEEAVSGNAICITMNTDSKSAPICLSGHMDTVHPIGLFGNPPTKTDIGSVPFSEAKIYAPGALDCKGGIVASFLAMAALDDIGYKERPVRLILQSDEEGGSVGSEKHTVKFMYDMSKDAVAFLNAEGCNGKNIIIERKGIQTYKFDISGRSEHSSRCYLGASAIREAAYKIIEIEKWKVEEGITCNVGVIEGGTVPNTVPDKCSFIVNVRCNNQEEMEYIEKELRKIALKTYVDGCSATVARVGYRVPMEKCKKNIALAEKINSIYEKCGLPVMPPGKSNGGSDAADMTWYGVPSVDNLGIEGARLHSPDEYALAASLARSAKRLASVVYCF